MPLHPRRIEELQAQGYKSGSAFRDKFWPELMTVPVICEEWLREKFVVAGATYQNFYDYRLELKDIGVTQGIIERELIAQYCPWARQAYLDREGEISGKGIGYLVNQRMRYLHTKPGKKGQSQERRPSELMSLPGSPWRGYYEAAAPHWKDLQSRDDARRILTGVSQLPKDLGDCGFVYVLKYPEGYYKVGKTMRSLDSRIEVDGSYHIGAVLIKGSKAAVDAAEAELKRETRHLAVKPGGLVASRTSEDRLFANDDDALGYLFRTLLSKEQMSELWRRRCEEALADYHARRLADLSAEYGAALGSVLADRAARMKLEPVIVERL
jgi:hypothetical protein